MVGGVISLFSVKELVLWNYHCYNKKDSLCIAA